VSDSFIIAGSAWSNTCYVLNKTTGEVETSWPAKYGVTGLSYAGQRGTVFISGTDSTIEECSLKTGTIVNSFQSPASNPPFGLGYSCAENVLFVGVGYDSVYVINPDNGSVIRSINYYNYYDGGLAADEAKPYSPWLSVTLAAGSVPAGGRLDMGVIFNSGTLKPGAYNGYVIFQPDPIENAPGPFTVPCSMAVEERRLSLKK